VVKGDVEKALCPQQQSSATGGKLSLPLLVPSQEKLIAEGEGRDGLCRIPFD